MYFVEITWGQSGFKRMADLYENGSVAVKIMGKYRNQWTAVTKPSQMHKSQETKWDLKRIMLRKR